MSDILILGAGLMQKPAILAAKELGYKACVIDADENAVCVSLADRFDRIDLKARETILEHAKKLQAEDGLAAVFTAGTDFSASVSYVTQALGLPSHSFEAACNASSKTRMRACFEKHGVPSPKYTGIDASFLENPLSYEDFCLKYFGSSCETLVIKPVDNMGGRGCRMVRQSSEFLPAVRDAVENSRTKNAVVEQYMDGPEFSIDALVFDGTVTVTGFAERHIYYPPYFIEMGHTMSAVLSKDMHDELISTFAMGIKALGLSQGVAKADIKYTKNGAMIGEIAGRLSGGYMSGWTFPYASEMNLTKNALLISLGKSPSELLSKRVPVSFKAPKSFMDAEKPFDLYEIPCSSYSAERAWISIPGTVKSVNGLKEASELEYIKDVMERATVRKGGDVDFPRNNVSKCGNVISKAQSLEKAVKASESAVSTIYIELEPHNQKTDDFLAGVSKDYEKDFPPSAFPGLEDLLSKIEGTIKDNAKVSDFLSDDLKTDRYTKQRDWNYLTAAESCIRFDSLRPVHKALDAKEFFRCLFRGGLQGALYYSDCL